MPQPAISVQPYSLRHHLQVDPEGTLARVRQMGISRVEPFAFPADADGPADRLRGAGLTATSGHEAFLEESISFGGRTILVPPRPALFAAARRLGMRVVEGGGRRDRGAVDLDGCLDAATGAELAVLEFDAFDGGVFAAIEEGADFLRARGLDLGHAALRANLRWLQDFCDHVFHDDRPA